MIRKRVAKRIGKVRCCFLFGGMRLILVFFALCWKSRITSTMTRVYRFGQVCHGKSWKLTLASVPRERAAEREREMTGTLGNRVFANSRAWVREDAYEKPLRKHIRRASAHREWCLVSRTEWNTFPVVLFRSYSPTYICSMYRAM